MRALPAFLARQRWFSDKHRLVESIELADSAFRVLGDRALLLAIANVQFAGGHRSTYFLPLLLGPNRGQTAASVCAINVSGELLEVVDAVPEPAFHRWLLQSIREGQHIASEYGRISSRLESDTPFPPSDLAGRLAGVEQSNSSILIGDSLIAKVYRRLSPGTNPDLEVGRYLNALNGHDITPALVGSVEYENDQGPATLVTVQEQLSEPVDCWSFVLASLDRGDWHAADIGEPLGVITARLHVALASGAESSGFEAGVATGEEIRAWRSAFEAALDQVSREVARHKHGLDPQTRRLADAFFDALPSLQHRSSGFDALAGLLQIRVHGDYHLGQILRLADGQLRIVDFEGEPQRPIAERRKKTSPLKDVAGMLRSFSYARGTAASTTDDDRRRHLYVWETEQRRQFTEAYRTVVRSSGLRLIPDLEQDIESAIAAWEIDKALYEVMYELSSRPDWLWIPLGALVELA